MAEVIGTISALLSILQIALASIDRIHRARYHLKDLGRILQNHHKEVETTLTIMQLVRDEKALQIPPVTALLTGLESVVNRLLVALQKLERTGRKGSWHRFSTHLVKGSTDKSALADILADLSRIKDNLSLKIQVINVGLVHSVQESIVAKPVIFRSNSAPAGERSCLMEYDSSDSPNPECTDLILFSDTESEPPSPILSRSIQESPTPFSSSQDSPLFSSRIVIENSATDYALQLNSPIGEAGWREVDYLEIKNNQASGKSIQLNHAASMDVFQQLLAARRMDITA